MALTVGQGLAVAKSKAASQSVIEVPADYHAKQQPAVVVQSFMLTLMQQGGSWEDKYKRVVGMLRENTRLMAAIKNAAKIYGVDPVHIVGAIVGEHTYNLNVLDSLQTYYVKALQYAKSDALTFQYHGEHARDFFKRPQFAECEVMKNNYLRWDCRETVWNDVFAGKFVDGGIWPPTRLNRVFFNPMFSGQTFGVGQIGPVAALMVTDLVHKKSGLPLLTMDDAPLVFQQIMNPDTSLHYIAATMRVSIDNYRDIAGFDISKNAGILATLYNLGDSGTRAARLKATNDQLAKQGKPPQFPQENFYGWFINDKIAELRGLVDGARDTAAR